MSCYDKLTATAAELVSMGFDEEQIQQLCFAELEDMQLPMSLEQAKEYSYLQLQQIIKAIVHGLDPAVLLDPSLSVYKMNEIRRFMEDCPNFEHSRLLCLDEQVIYQLRRFVKTNLPFEDLIVLGVTWTQLDLCYRLTKDGRRSDMFDSRLRVKGLNDLYLAYFNKEDLK